MVYVTASPARDKQPSQDPSDGPSAWPDATSNTSSPNLTRRSSSTTVLHSTLNSSNSLYAESGRPFSLSFLHKKRPSDATSETNSLASGSLPGSPTLVRKKSGELVKSSLKLNSLASGVSKSMPTTPTYNKSVHFGVDVDVRYFDEGDKPTAVSADASPILRAMAKQKKKAQFHMHGNDDDDDDDDDYDDDDYDEDEDEMDLDDETDIDEDNTVIVWEMRNMNFNKIKYNEKFAESSKLFLEKLILDERENCITGSIAAKNLSFQKVINIRYTFDCWRTVIEIEATFTKEVTRILKRANYDRFIFKIPLERFEMLKNDQTDISFCIWYRYGDEEVWDNNYHKNYQVRLTRSRKLGQARSSKQFLNDYFSSSDHNPVSAPTAESIHSYFNNYEMIKSPETPKVLKNNEHLLDTPEFTDLDQHFSDTISDSVNKLSLYSDTSNVDLLRYKENLNYTTVSVPPHLIPGFLSSQNSSLQPTPQGSIANSTETTPEKLRKTNTPADTVSKTKKPMINSKSYQELLDSYCFYKPTTVSSYLQDDSMKEP